MSPGTPWEFANELRKVWRSVEVQILVLFSLALQVILIFSAGQRKRVAAWWLSLLLWSAYLLADLVAIYAIGLVHNSQNPLQPPIDPCDAQLLAFWSPFLILHLGGPDTITSFSLEDNELWLRHLLTLVFQAAVAALVIIKSLLGTTLFPPAALIFTAGILKCGERTSALRSASMKCLRESLLPRADPGPRPDYDKLKEVLAAKYHAEAIGKELADVQKELAAIRHELAVIEEKLATSKEVDTSDLDPRMVELGGIAKRLMNGVSSSQREGSHVPHHKGKARRHKERAHRHKRGARRQKERARSRQKERARHHKGEGQVRQNR